MAHVDVAQPGPTAPISIVIASRDRRESLLETLARLTALPERPPLIVVDNGSTDGSPPAVRATFPSVRLVELPTNRGAPARNVGVRAADTPLVAFSDDDSWWEPGSLSLAVDTFARHPRLGLLAARILVGADGRLDPACVAMAGSPLPTDPDLPGPSVLGFVSCGAIVRRDAFLASGGFDDVVFFFGEEERVAVDLAAAGWGLAYVDEVVARHRPSPSGRTDRSRLQIRNQLLSQWMRRPAPVALGSTLRVACRALSEPVSRGALVDAMRRLGPALRGRRRVPPHVEEGLRRLDDAFPSRRLGAPAIR